MPSRTFVTEITFLKAHSATDVREKKVSSSASYDTPSPFSPSLKKREVAPRNRSILKREHVLPGRGSMGAQVLKEKPKLTLVPREVPLPQIPQESPVLLEDSGWERARLVARRTDEAVKGVLSRPGEWSGAALRPIADTADDVVTRTSGTALRLVKNTSDTALQIGGKALREAGDAAQHVTSSASRGIGTAIREIGSAVATTLSKLGHGIGKTAGGFLRGFVEGAFRGGGG